MNNKQLNDFTRSVNSADWDDRLDVRGYLLNAIEKREKALRNSFSLEVEYGELKEGEL